MDKEKYKVDLQAQSITRADREPNHGITIYATASEVERLRRTFDTLQSADFITMFRANVPIVPYHNSKSSDQYDSSFTEAVQTLYDLGDEEAKQFIDDIGILGDRPIDTKYSYPNNHSQTDQ